MKSKNKNLQTMDDLVFDNRNKEYGAFQLRKNYSKFLNQAFALGVSVFTSIFLSAWTHQIYFASKLNHENVKTVDINLDNYPEETILEKQIELPPPPPPIRAQELAQIKYLPPEPKKDHEITMEEPPPPTDQIEAAIISKQTMEGAKPESDYISPPMELREQTKPLEIEKPLEEEIFTTVEQNPLFPGGLNEMYRYIGQNLRYPTSAARANVTGKVFIRFVIERDGSIVEAQILKGIGFGCDEEAMRVIKSMPKWSPGKQNGRAVRVYYTIPINYTLE